MKILFVMTLDYLPQSAGGSKSSTHELCTLLKSRGHDVAVLCSLKPKGLIGIRNRFKRKIFPKVQCPSDHVLGYPVFRGWNPIENIFEVVRKFKPDISVTQAGKSAEISEALISLGLINVFYVRDVIFEKMGGKLNKNPLVTYISNSKFTASVLKKEFNLDSYVIPPIVIPEKYEVKSSRESVLHINPHPLKGIEITLELANRRKDIDFDIIESWSVGETLIDQYKKIADGLPNVTWHKRIHDMRKIYSRTRIVIAPSQCDEAWGRIATEAHINGIPVVASHIGGLPEAVGQGGVLVAPNAPIEEWEKALSNLWDNHTLYMAYSEAALEYSKRKEIQPETLISDFTNILNEHITKTNNIK